MTELWTLILWTLAIIGVVSAVKLCLRACCHRSDRSDP